MTTFQDPQPQSRRAARQGERVSGAEQPAAGEFPAQPPTASAAPQYFSDADTQRDMWDTNARRAAQLPAGPAPRSESAPKGRRAAPSASPPPPAAEPLSYSTASRQPSVPNYDPQSFRSRLDARQAQQEPVAPTEAGQSFRMRDFSPESRRAAQAAERAAAAPAWVPTAPPTDLDYQTEVREGFGTPQTPAAPVAPISQVPPQYAIPPMADAPGEQTLTRRELRALLAEEAAAGRSQPAPSDEVAHRVPIVWHTPAPAPTSASASILEPAPLAQPSLHAAQPLLPAAQPPGELAPLQAPQAYEAIRIPELSALAPVSPLSTPTSAIADSAALIGWEPALAVEAGDASGLRPRVNHWSIQNDGEGDSTDATVSRQVGSGTSATNALVMPETPLGSDIRGALTSTGEVMLTGTIDLPHSLSSSGASDQIDHDGIDGLFDLPDHEVTSTDSQPVRAIKAVSTHQTGGVTHTQKPKGTRALTVLLIAASSMAVVVAGLLIVAFAFNLF